MHLRNHDLDILFMAHTANHTEKLFLVDAYALIFRAYFAFGRNPLLNSKGQNVSAINGFTNTLFELIQKEKPTHLAVVFDLGGSTEREEAFADYKAGRQETPEDILFAVPYIKDIIRAWHIPILELSGYEADDIIGTIAKKKAAEGHLVYMVTPDKDYAQLVDQNIFIYKPARSGGVVEILGVEEIKRDWEVQDPKQVIDILGMWGDAVDNIPGIPGVGEKTAKKFIKEYGSMENTIAHADSIKGKVGENVKAFAEQGLLSKKLATINLQVPIEVSDDDLKMDAPDKEKMGAIFAELEFRTLGKRILGSDYQVNQATSLNPSEGGTSTGASDAHHAAAPPNANQEQGNLFGDTASLPPLGGQGLGKSIHNTTHQYTIVQTESEIKDLVNVLHQADEFCFDTETTGLDYFALDMVGMSFSVKEGEAYYVPVPASYEAALPLEPLRLLFRSMKTAAER